MNDSYAETAVKRKTAITNYLIKFALIAVVFISLVFTMGVFGMFSIIIGMVGILACVLVFPYLSVEFEYVFCDGQIDFDKIYSGNKRKTAIRIDFEYVEIMAPVNSHALDSYANTKCKVMDFSSHEKDSRVYAIFVRQGEQFTKILCEPNEKMLAAIKQKSPRKLSEY